ncbi:3-deoxy-7-phosphoheptulonate synthase [Streptomyces sp. NBC_01766]|uniref:3-deoxy-7-phosphoheptulonate synthase n=1 Tax=Streptomyces sp. NBC_01766 TaxID=2975936 RepID=UPI002DD969A8|nr:3-deoxy-7-phosphoheptulonate synthase [Streptomyces sp. NBC_01766]WSC19237.1 3-deoxy-7-phosphoheptulonate synthase [Streptomyces sp. NBC_01766]
MTDIETRVIRTAESRPPGPDPVREATAELRSCPPLVLAAECELLKRRLAQAARGEGFVLQCGARPATFDGATGDTIRHRLRTLLQMSALLTYATSLPVVKISRIAGPAGNPVSGYRSAAATLNLVRAFAAGGYADLRRVHDWNLDFVANSPCGASYESLTTQIGRALTFMRACGTAPEPLRTVELFASHEGLLPDYDSALTRADADTGRLYNTAGHFVGLGTGTRAGAGTGAEELDPARVDHAATISNPLGVVLGPDSGHDEALDRLDRLDPAREPGRLTFLVRMGGGPGSDRLSALIEKVTAEGHLVTWICDPLHDTASDAPRGGASSRFDVLRDRVTAFFDVHRALGTHPGGIHVELTGAASGAGTVTDAPAAPGLSHSGALDLAFLVAELYRSGTGAGR